MSKTEIFYANSTIPIIRHDDDVSVHKKFSHVDFRLSASASNEKCRRIRATLDNMGTMLTRMKADVKDLLSKTHTRQPIIMQEQDKAALQRRDQSFMNVVARTAADSAASTASTIPKIASDTPALAVFLTQPTIIRSCTKSCSKIKNQAKLFSQKHKEFEMYSSLLKLPLVQEKQDGLEVEKENQDQPKPINSHSHERVEFPTLDEEDSQLIEDLDDDEEEGEFEPDELKSDEQSEDSLESQKEEEDEEEGEVIVEPPRKKIFIRDISRNNPNINYKFIYFTAH